MRRIKRIDAADWLESMAEEEALPETSERMSEKEALELARVAGYDTEGDAIERIRALIDRNL
jgi:hypothetical protein